MKKLRTNSFAYQFLICFWAKQCRLDETHRDWATAHIGVPSVVCGQRLYREGQLQKNIYLVARGMLGRISTDGDTDERSILSIALPGMALFTTKHPHSNTYGKGDLVVLRARTVVLEIPYKALRAYDAPQPDVDTLIHILLNKKKAQLADLIYALQPREARDRYAAFVSEMPELKNLLSYQEIADFVRISLSTVKRMATEQAKKPKQP